MDLSDLIERNAAFAPDKPALVFEGEVLSYAAFQRPHRAGGAGAARPNSASAAATASRSSA